MTTAVQADRPNGLLLRQSWPAAANRCWAGGRAPPAPPPHTHTCCGRRRHHWVPLHAARWAGHAAVLWACRCCCCDRATVNVGFDMPTQLVQQLKLRRYKQCTYALAMCTCQRQVSCISPLGKTIPGSSMLLSAAAASKAHDPLHSASPPGRRDGASHRQLAGKLPPPSW